MEPPPAGSLFEAKPLAPRAARCVLDGVRGTLRVYSQLLDHSGAVAEERDDTLPLSGALMRPTGEPTAAARELGKRFRASGRRAAEAAAAARVAATPGGVAAARLEALTADGRAWRVTLLPEQVKALLPLDQVPDADGPLASGMELFVSLLPQDALPPPPARGAGAGRPRKPELTVSRTASSLVEGILTALCPTLVNGEVRIAALQRKPGVISKVALELGSYGEITSPRRMLLGFRSGGDLSKSVRELLGISETIHLLDVPAAGPAASDEDVQAFVAASLWPGMMQCVRLDAEPGGGAYAYALDELEVSKAVGKRGGNIAVASALVRRLYPDRVHSVTVRNPGEAAADGVQLRAPPPTSAFAPLRDGARDPSVSRGGAQGRPDGRSPTPTRRAGASARDDAPLPPRAVPSKAEDDALLAALLSEAPPVYGGTPAASPGASFWGELSLPAAEMRDAEGGLFDELGESGAAAAERKRWADELDELSTFEGPIAGLEE
jgi:transcription antitermination factor NusA-like protein